MAFVISPGVGKTWWLAVSENAMEEGFISAYPSCPPWQVCVDGQHSCGGTRKGGGWKCEIGGFRGIEDAIAQLKEIVVPGTRLTSSNYHGPEWPIKKTYCNNPSEQW